MFSSREIDKLYYKEFRDDDPDLHLGTIRDLENALYCGSIIYMERIERSSSNTIFKMITLAAIFGI